MENSKNQEFLLSLHSILVEEKLFDLAVLIGICLKSESLISKTLCDSDLKSRYECRLKK